MLISRTGRILRSLTLAPQPRPYPSPSAYSFSQNPNPEHQQQRRQKRQAERIQKLRQKQQQQVKDLNDRVNLTKGSYSPLMSYMKINRGILIACALIAGMGWFGLKIWGMGGVYPVEELEQRNKVVDGQEVYQYEYTGIKNKKKLTIVSQKYQQEHLAEPIYRLYSDIYPTVQKDHLTPALTSKLSNLESKLASIFHTPISIIPLQSEQPIAVALPGNRILLSKSILRSPQLAYPQLQMLVLLSYQLFVQGYHIRTLSLRELSTFWNTNEAGSTIKLRQIYSRVYKRSQILESLHLLNLKLSAAEPNPLIESSFKNLEILQKENTSKTAPCQENIYQRLYKYYILVKNE